MSQQADDLLKLVQVRGVPVVLLERIDSEPGRKRKYSSVEPESSDEDVGVRSIKISPHKAFEFKIPKYTDDDGDSGIDGCSSVRSSIQGVPTCSHDDKKSQEDSFSDHGLFAKPRNYYKEPLDNGEYAVQKVLLHKYSAEGSHLFFIKWKGWGSEHNTWEPLKHLHCPDLITDFFKNVALDALKGKSIMPYCPPYNNRAYREILKMWIENVSTNKVIYSLRHNPKERPAGAQKLMDMLDEAVRLGNCSKSMKLVEEVKAQCVLRKRFHTRRAQKEKLRLWEEAVNKIGPGGLSVENDVDLEVLPENFKFVDKCVMGEGVDPPQPALVGCECQSCDKYQERCCPDLANAEFAYNRANLFVLDQGYPIYECNSLCKCGPDCMNRVVQKGRQVRLTIFRTNNGRGWGVKAGQHIRKGSFISTYIGEVLRLEEAEQRAEEYEKEGLAYLFDLDYTYDDECTYSVDATYIGNESHFINHSCDPNSYVVGVYSENLDPKMPLLALFASRNICRGEEITFNYNGNTDKTVTDDQNPPSPRKLSVPCKCGSRKCTKYLFKTRMTNLNMDDSISLSQNISA